MRTKLGGHGDGSAEEKEDIEGIEGDGDDGVAGEGLIEADAYQIEERQHGKGGHEDVVVDEGRVARESGGNHVADQGHDDEDAEKLDRENRSVAGLEHYGRKEEST